MILPDAVAPDSNSTVIRNLPPDSNINIQAKSNTNTGSSPYSPSLTARNLGLGEITIRAGRTPKEWVTQIFLQKWTDTL